MTGQECEVECVHLSASTPLENWLNLLSQPDFKLLCMLVGCAARFAMPSAKVFTIWLWVFVDSGVEA